ncbi:MAG: hypothetical protein ACO1N0_06760 [Fluviicola sp.]
MLRIIFIFLAASFVSSASSFGQTTDVTPKKKNQTTGFYGKRFTLQLGVGGHHNSLLKLVSYQERKLRTNNYYNRYRDKINDDHFNYSFYGNLGLVLKERTALSLDFNYYSGNIFLENINQKQLYDDYGYYYGTSGGYDARVKYTTMRIMPRIEIGSRGSNMPTGLVNVLGIGVELSKLKSGNYQTITSSDYSDSASIGTQRLKFEDEFSFNLTLLYGLEYRLPISKNIAWNFGGYFHVNFPVQLALDEFFGDIDFGYGNSTDYQEEYRLQLAKYRFQNLFSLRTGVVIML